MSQYTGNLSQKGKYESRQRETKQGHNRISSKTGEQLWCTLARQRQYFAMNEANRQVHIQEVTTLA